MKRVTLFIVVAITSFGSIASTKPGCECKSVDSASVTRSGGNEWDAYQEKGVFQTIRGKVEMPLPELNEDILVEVFDQPDYLICEWRENNPNNCTMTPPDSQRRIAACVTGKKGTFCFSNLPAGRYELRLSKGNEWSPTHVVVQVNPKRGSSESIEARLRLGF